jgi:hypothetical protein
VCETSGEQVLRVRGQSQATRWRTCLAQSTIFWPQSVLPPLYRTHFAPLFIEFFFTSALRSKQLRCIPEKISTGPSQAKYLRGRIAWRCPLAGTHISGLLVSPKSYCERLIGECLLQSGSSSAVTRWPRPSYRYETSRLRSILVATCVARSAT